MTHPTYTQQALSRYSLSKLKRIAAELGVTPTLDKRIADTWVNAILNHQSTQLHKVDEQAIAPEELTPVEISFYDHEYYNGDKLVAAITYEDDLTQPWVVMVNGAEIHRANTWAKCHNFITWHHKDGSLPVQQEALVQGALSMGENISPLHPAPCPLSSSTTGNKIIAQVAVECEKFELEILDDGIYRDNEKLGEVGCTNGNWWFIRAGEQERVKSDSALDAVWWLSMVDVSFATNTESFLDKPLEQMTGNELQQLLEKGELVAA
ncbi:hypothetical protein [aff. Roholtiella sp. LEGE 12411]|uniref:hypothetical protein n=1 Tax=aff. Roholtiella sp. LEGE 12411 TaxID=1828822 RepID=UPI001880DA70|nr:hypothetical protein [aff. Roholtiella sp. LEGE 12411]MBE9037194.1 hypothetical protein [aff. Roholtiella sp. LEGE 12411]